MEQLFNKKAAAFKANVFNSMCKWKHNILQNDNPQNIKNVVELVGCVFNIPAFIFSLKIIFITFYGTV